MKIRNFVAAPLIALALSSCSGGGSSIAEESFVSGSGSVSFIKQSDRIAAPQLSGMTLSGKNYEFKGGQVAVINVWASWCAPCRAEAPTLAALSQKYSDVAFIGILTRDNPVNAEAFVLIGFRKSLPANAIPSTVVVDKKGEVAARISGEVTVASLSELIEKVSAE